MGRSVAEATAPDSACLGLPPNDRRGAPPARQLCAACRIIGRALGHSGDAGRVELDDAVARLPLPQ